MTEMRTFRLDKLVRDGIVEGHEKIGGSAEFEKLEGLERASAGLDKIQEELDEARTKLGTTGKIGLDELVDIRQAAEDLAEAEGHSLTELHSHQYDKKRRVGRFSKWLFVRKVTVPGDSDLASYYESDPNRFPEVQA